MRRLVVGLGNPNRGEDGVGLEAVRRVQSAPTCRIMCCSDLWQLWDRADEIILVDAMCSGAQPGTVRRFEAHADPLPTGGFVSTHALGPAEAIELARALGRLPNRVIVYGIEVGVVGPGHGMSKEVREAARKVAEEIDDARANTGG